MGLAWPQFTPGLPLSNSPVLLTMSWLEESDAEVHDEHEKLAVADLLARVPATMAEPSTGDADQSIHAPPTGSCSDDAARRYSDA